MTHAKMVVIFWVLFLGCASGTLLQAEEKKQEVRIEVLNPEYSRPPDPTDNVDIGPASGIEDILKKIDYYYATRDFGKAIELGELALTKTDDKILLAIIHFSLSSNYLEKGIEPYTQTKDDSFYQRSLEHARKCLEGLPNSWQALGNIATIYLNTRDWKQAAFYYAEAQKYLDPSDPSYAALETERLLAEHMIGKE